MEYCRNEFVNCRLTKNEKYILEILALNDGRSVSEKIRELIRKDAEERGIQNIGLINEKCVKKPAC